MKKTIHGYIKDLPEGCVAETDIFGDNGVLLCPKMSVVNARLLKSLSHYHGRIVATVTVADPVKEEPIVEEDNSVELSESFKKYSVETLSSIYANIDNADYVIQEGQQVCAEACSFLMAMKANEIGINLSKLKVSDEYTYKHSVDVGVMSATLAKHLGFDDLFIKDIAVAGLLHDLGKERVPTEILNKPAKLTDEEFSIMKLHPVHGYSILRDSKDLSEEIRRGILNHHENIDGSGYPRGLKDVEIGDMGKIIAITDVFDALVTARPYKAAKTPSQAIEIMFTMFTKFDVDYFRGFLDIINAYPNGSLIKLSNGELATVLKQNRSYPLRPVIQLDETGQIVDMANDQEYLCVTIVS